MYSKLTPREATVMLLLDEGLSIADIFRSGFVKSLYNGKPLKSRQQIYSIRNRAIRKLKRNNHE